MMMQNSKGYQKVYILIYVIIDIPWYYYVPGATACSVPSASPLSLPLWYSMSSILTPIV